jgi:hypothetical protein
MAMQPQSIDDLEALMTQIISSSNRESIDGALFGRGVNRPDDFSQGTP